MCWEGATVINPVQRCQDVPGGGRGLLPQSILGELCLPKGHRGQPPKSLRQRLNIGWLFQKDLSSVGTIDFSGSWRDDRLRPGVQLGSAQ